MGMKRLKTFKQRSVLPSHNWPTSTFNQFSQNRKRKKKKKKRLPNYMLNKKHFFPAISVRIKSANTQRKLIKETKGGNIKCLCQLRASTKAGQVTKWYKIEIQMAGAPNLLLRLWTSSPTEKSMVWKIVNNNNEVPQRFLLTKSPMLGCCGSKKIQQIFMVCIQRWTSKKR